MNARVETVHEGARFDVASAALRTALGVLSPAGRGARLSILIFHRVRPTPDPLFPDLPDAAAFEQQMRWVRDWFNVVPLPEAAERIASHSLPARAAVITFDDGYADNAEVALPILRRLRMPATFFISTGFLDGGQMWNDTVIEAMRASPRDELDLREIGLEPVRMEQGAGRRAVIEKVLAGIKHRKPDERRRAVEFIEAAAGGGSTVPAMMTSAQVTELHQAGMTIGGHTVWHPILTRLPRTQARDEIMVGKERLEALTRAKVDVFAYPNGVPNQDYAKEHVELVRMCGFRSAVSTAWGCASGGADLYQLPRFSPWDRGRLKYGVRMLGNLRRTRYTTV